MPRGLVQFVLFVGLIGAGKIGQGATGDILWTYDTGGPVFASPTLGRDGTIYIGSNASSCVALSPTSGDPVEKWTYMANDWIDATAAIGEDGTVYVGTYDSTLVALDPDTGEAKWEITLGEGEGLFGVVQGSPAITSEGLIIVITSAGLTHAILPSGEEAWFFEFGADSRSSPAIDLEDRIYFGADDGLLRCLNVSGELEWSFAVDGAGEETSRIYGSPSIDGDGNVYVGAGNGFLYSVDAAGQLRWRFATPEAVDVNPAVDAENNIYFASRNGSLYCVSQEGELCWSNFLGDIFYSSPIIDANGFVYITYFGGQGSSYVVAFAPGGAEVWQTEITAIIDSSLVLTPDGTLLVGAFDGLVYAIESDAGQDYTVPWARFRRDTRGRGRVIEGALPEIAEGLRPLVLPQGGTGRLDFGDTQGGETFAWRRDGETLGVTALPNWTVGPLSQGDIAFYDVVVSNEVGEVVSPMSCVAQLGDLRWSLVDGVPSLSMIISHPVNDGIAFRDSSDLMNWGVDGVTVIRSENLSADIQETEIALPMRGDREGYVRMEWQP